jgi:hypothetical protein
MDLTHPPSIPPEKVTLSSRCPSSPSSLPATLQPILFYLHLISFPKGLAASTESLDPLNGTRTCWGV